MRRPEVLRIGVDAGGTFTDFVVARSDGRLESFKLRSNPRSPASVILAGIERAAAGAPAEVVHGSTVATNALLERKGAPTAFVTTAGFEDIVHIGRQNRRELYHLTPGPQPYLIPRQNCFGVDERSLASGRVLRSPDPAEVRRLAATLQDRGLTSVAICFLHAYQTDVNEVAVEQWLSDAGLEVSRSSDIAPEFREYERASTTLLNAYVRPLMNAYLQQLSGTRDIAILQSNGGSMTTAEAGRYAVRTLLSGPAGGVIGAFHTARASGFDKVLGFDMGGTSTDVSLIEGTPRQTVEGSIAGFPIRVPMLDIHTVGAGGGSIARVDEGGLLRVGPESAGADPGPACYGVGDEPTVTDAHVVVGRIAADQLAGGSLPIDPSRSAAAIDRLAATLNLDRVRAAEGVLRIANANMERAIRVVSVERGYDPREFALLAFGGGGGLHACEIAVGLGMRTVIVPAHAGALSALGMLVADRIRDYAAGALGLNDRESRFRLLESQALRDMPVATLERNADLRYVGQSYELNVAWEPDDPAAPFHREHQKIYGYADPSRDVQVVTLRVRARVPAEPVDLSHAAASHNATASSTSRKIYMSGAWYDTPVLTRDPLRSGVTSGPALVVDYGATTLVLPGWSAQVDAVGNLILRMENGTS